jgi:glutathione peroxidase
MKKLALVLLLAACSKATDTNSAKPPADPPANQAKDPPKVIKGTTASASDPDKLPPAGTAPPAVTVAKEIPMWNAAIHTLKGADTKLADFRGKGLLLVNVASECGLTPQYEQLEALQKKYGPKGFTVVGFPCNQFGGQEPGSAEEIQTFCSKNYGVTFPMMEKIEVNGAKRHEIYKTLTDIADASGHKGDIRWNFEKFVISADGTKVTRFSPKTKPDDPAVIAAIEQALPAK